MTSQADPVAGSQSFRHLLAYGNSDQASFRHAEVRDSFDTMTVPGTIASYYDEATAAFVLSSKIPYLIDPRTPLFQDELAVPRASHYTLADWHGQSVRAHLPADGAPARFPSSFWTSPVVVQMVTEIVDRQRAYAANAPRVTKKLNRYAKLLAEAMHRQEAEVPPGDPSGPSAVLAPYFAVTGTSDAWWSVMKEVWAACGAMPDPSGISPVLCVGPRLDQTASGTSVTDGVGVLAELLSELPAALDRTAYVWITGFDERGVEEDTLRRLWRTVAVRPQGWDLINMYGGFFSICLRYAGLAGFGNGLTYSESRAWPALAATGSAPPRYYIRDLHLFLPPATAAALIDAEPRFECPCNACAELRAAGGTIAAMPYHALKRHFALARAWELDVTATLPPRDVATTLRTAKQRLDTVRPRLPRGASPNGEHLARWANVLEKP